MQEFASSEFSWKKLQWMYFRQTENYVSWKVEDAGRNEEPNMINDTLNQKDLWLYKIIWIMLHGVLTRG